MNYYVGIDVSLEASSLCVVDANGKIVREGKIASEPDALIAWQKGLKLELTRIGLEAGPLSQWLYAAMRQAGMFERKVQEPDADSMDFQCVAINDARLTNKIIGQRDA
jgi:hypothetical protein